MMMEGAYTQFDRDLLTSEFESLLSLARVRCRSDKEIETIRRAYEFAYSALEGERRRNGEPYMLHPVSVARIVVSDIGLGYKSICAALLHDVPHRSSYGIDDIRRLFGDKIAQLVDGLSEIKHVLDEVNRKGLSIDSESVHMTYLKRILLTLGEDARVVLIKLADRLHNCRNMESMPQQKKDKILPEVMYIFIPLAHRLGLYSVKSEMENIWLRFSEPDAYSEISGLIQESISKNNDSVEEFIAPIEGLLRRDDYDFSVKTRIKSPYSVWHKMQKKRIPFDQIYDLYAVRIVYRSMSTNPEIERAEAYKIYADIASLYKDNPSRRRDWIVDSKDNGYEALHGTFMSLAGIWVEVQIRSQRMDDIAEKGLAAHWSYKRGGYASENETKMDEYLAGIKEMLDNNIIDLL